MNDMTVAQPINGSRGATVAGPRNIPLEAQVPDIFTELLWLAAGFIMVMAVFLAAASE
jgi:hypothetical protein